LDRRTGEVTVAEEEARRAVIAQQHKMLIETANLTRPARRELARTGKTRVYKNSPCPCGSKKRFKNCHQVKP
jgi:uncharacterized protein YecA (UPF0149 family)